MSIKQKVISGNKYNDIETNYIIDRLSEDSRMTVHDSRNDYVDTRVVICRADDSGYVYVRILDGEGRAIGDEHKVETGYYISGCEYAQLTI